MPKPDFRNILGFIRKLGRPVFTTHELVSISGRSASTVIQCLNRLVRQEFLTKPYRGIWMDTARGNVSAFDVIPCLFPRQRAYVSFITALHLYGIVEQIPQMITVASLSHSRTIRTKLGVYSVHQIAPDFFAGFDWYKAGSSFLIAEPEKALIDSLYLSSRKKKQYGYFPELHFPSTFSFKRAAEWGRRIPEANIRRYVLSRLGGLQNAG